MLDPRFTIWEWIILLGATQGVFLALVFLSQRRGNVTANRFLGLLLLVFSLRLFEITAFWTQYLLVWPHLWTTTFAVPYLFGPLLYLYTSSLRSKPRLLNLKALAHVCPFLLTLLFQMPFLTMPADLKRDLLLAVYRDIGELSQTSMLATLVFLLQIPHLAAYTLVVLRNLRRDQFFKSPKSRQLRLKAAWLRRLALGFCGLFGLWLIHSVSLNWGLPYIQWLDYASVYGMTIGIYAIGYTAIRKPEIHQATGPKYQKSTLKSDESSDLAGRVVEVMRQSKPWLENDLRLPKLAEIIGVPTHHLSQVLNEQLQQNFNDFVNGYRIEEAKRRILDPNDQHITMLAIALEVGFNNKTSFNASFRKLTGMTPTEYRSKHQPSP